MTKKHFIALADALRSAQPLTEEQALAVGGAESNVAVNYREGRRVQHQHTLLRLATFCEQQNPQFNRQRWLDYIAGRCGPSGGARP